MDPDFEGDGTARFLAEELRQRGVQVTRIARGVPAGSAIEYSNAAVLAEAVAGRRELPGGS
jgi:recombination protein RecR